MSWGSPLRKQGHSSSEVPLGAQVRHLPHLNSSPGQNLCGCLENHDQGVATLCRAGGLSCLPRALKGTHLMTFFPDIDQEHRWEMESISGVKSGHGPEMALGVPRAMPSGGPIACTFWMG